MLQYAPSVAANARNFMNVFFLSGDGSNGTSANGSTFSYVNSQVGYGRMRTHWFLSGTGSDPSLGAPWTWGATSMVVTQGNTTTWNINGGTPLPASATQYRVSVFWDEEDLQSVSDITLSLWDTCPSGGGTPTLIGQDITYALHKRVILNSNLAGRCLQGRLSGWETPTAGKTVYVSDYFHSGTPELP
jgi:hypothetical protein